MGNWKLIWSRQTAQFELYDLDRDISESINVAKDHPEIVARMTKLLNEHSSEIVKNSRPFGQPAKTWWTPY